MFTANVKTKIRSNAIDITEKGKSFSMNSLHGKAGIDMDPFQNDYKLLTEEVSK